MEILRPASALNATARTAAGPGRRSEDTLGRGRSYGFFGDRNPRLTSDLAVAAGAAPRFAVVRWTGRDPLHVTSATASHPLLPAASGRVRLTATASPPLLPAAPGTDMHRKRGRQQIRCGKKNVPPTEIPWSFSVAIKFSRQVAEEIERICKFICQYADEMWSRPEMAKARLETSKIQIVLCNALLNMVYKILQRVISATNEPSTVGTSYHQMMPLPETPRCLSPIVKLSSELVKEMVMIAKFFWQWALYLWSRPETENLRMKMLKTFRWILLKILDVVIAATNEPSEVDVTDAEPAKTRPPLNSPPVRDAEPARTRPPSNSPSVRDAEHARTKPPLSSPPEQETTQRISKQQLPTQRSKSKKNLKRSVNRMARDLLMLIMNDTCLKVMKVLKRKFISILVYNLAFVTCLWASKEVASQSERAVAFQLLAVQCWKAMLAYNLPEKILAAGAVMQTMILRAAKACKAVETSYNISQKMLTLWGKVEMTGKAAESMSAVFMKIENAYTLLLKLTKGGK